jgi:G3E family GTPase
MKILLIGGFLGSGKTTVLLKLAKYLTDNGERIVIIENEIGEIGIDDKLLKSGGFEVRELFSGCACCTSGGDLLQDINRIMNDGAQFGNAQFNEAPDRIIIEATGVAYPLAIKESVEREFNLSVSVLALADAFRWRRLIQAMPELIKTQLNCADVILLNKRELSSNSEISEICEELTLLNPTAQIFPVSATEFLDTTIWRALL